MGDCGPREASWGEIVGMDVSDALLALMCGGNRGATGPGMTPKKQISKNDNSVAYSHSVVLLPTLEQYPKSFFIVMFALFHLPVTYTGKEIFTSIGRIQHKEAKALVFP